MANWKVVTTARDRAKTVFDGPEKAARTFIENNFPRPHVEPPGSADEATPDVVLVNPDSGGQEQYHADNGWSAVTKKDGSALA